MLCGRWSRERGIEVTVRSFMTFTAPLVARDADKEAEVSPTGKELALAFAQGLVQRGLTLTEKVDQHDSYGWYFVVRAGNGKRVWCMLQESDLDCTPLTGGIPSNVE